MEEETEEEVDVEDGKKVFTSSRTGKRHYYEVVQEMNVIKGMPPTTHGNNSRMGAVM